MPEAAKKILFVLTSHDRKGDKPSGFFLSEATHPHRVLTKAGHAVDFVSPNGGAAPIDPDSFDLKDPINRAFWEDQALRSAVEQTRTPSQIKADAYDAIFYAGGHGAMWDLPDDAALAGIAARIYERGGVVGAVCHGPAGLINVKLADGRHLVAGKDVAAFTNDEERAVELEKAIPFSLADRLIERGARHRPAPNWEPNVVVSERLVTGQNPASATGVGEAIAKLLAQAR
jgi:putative intracellular protease/amidase